MASKNEVELRNFFIFNSTVDSKEGEELKKILYYYPITDNADIQINNVGLVEGIIQFTETFKPTNELNCLHTQKTRQLYFQPEKNFWFVMTLNVPVIVKNKELSNVAEYLDDELQDNVYKAVLQEAYYMYRLLNGKIEDTVKNSNIGILKTKLEKFYQAYMNAVKLANSDILNIFSGIQYLPLDTHTFLKVQCFINSLECNHPEVQYSAFLYNDHLIWSGVDPNNMQIIYRYLISTVLPKTDENEKLSTNKNSLSPFTTLQWGRFITGPTNLKAPKLIEEVPKIYIFLEGKCVMYFLIVYKALDAYVCLFINAEEDLTLNFFRELDAEINSKLISLATDISDYCQKQVVSPLNVSEATPKFIYFNKLNLAYKSTVHLDNKQTGNITCSKDLLKVIGDLNSKQYLLGCTGETVVKTMNDYWVVAKSSNAREFYIVIQQKNANLIDIVDEVKKICDSELKGIFFHPL